MFNDFSANAAKEYQLPISPEQIEAYHQYYQLLIEWNEKINLTAITEPNAVAVKHIIDSLSCYDPKIFHPGAKLIDVGTGAGFPGLPLKIWQKDLNVTLLDSLQKRVNFLTTVVEQLGLENVEVIHSRAEEGAKQGLYRERYDIAVSRAVARLSVLSELCMPFVKVGGYFVALKGAQYQEEINDGKRAIQLLGGKVETVVPIKLPGLDDIRAVIYIKKIKATPHSYPRKAGTPEKNPL